MPALLAIFLVLALTLILLYFVLRDFGIITTKQKIIALVVLIAFGVFATIYSYFQSKSDKNDMLLQTAFLRGESLECGGVIINRENFNLVTGTLSLIGKKNGPMNNIIISLDTCKITTQEVAPEESSRNLQEELQRD
ncbi:hypothetical protein BKH46_00210 [Helicobacter sp. 12S02634-8]|uniref:hypothetical protein n=1 Tax=Helicobacter sp. 12S02634-8 TaxID=1476199 RepID=UPI000BA767E5|nr:hypothetical protein [Helicobacter sp. 12S02634-8]PAF48377.1 hypothetical protein BKH46_00210 [Helicobacter sp. 12S02634-8]